MKKLEELNGRKKTEEKENQKKENERKEMKSGGEIGSKGKGWPRIPMRKIRGKGRK